MQSSYTLSILNLRPSENWLTAESRLQHWFAAEGVFNGRRSPRSLSAATASNGEFFFAVEPLDALAVHWVAIAVQQHVQAPIAEAPTLQRRGLQPIPRPKDSPTALRSANYPERPRLLISWDDRRFLQHLKPPCLRNLEVAILCLHL